MEKLSLYDLLSLLLPGIIFIFFLNTLSSIYGLTPSWIVNDNWTSSIGISLCFALIAGAALYATNFYLVKNIKWYNRIFCMYKHVADIYFEKGFLHKLMGETLNSKAKDWYNKEIFYTKDDYYKKSNEEQKSIKDNQDEYYDRMYYELDNNGKIEHARAFQSFYFFFRQTVLACSLLLIIHTIIYTVCFIPCSCIKAPEFYSALYIFIVLTILLITSAKLAQWYRKQMVIKMYWTYFTHLNNK